MPQTLSRRPRIALLGVYLARYDRAFPGYRARMSAFLEHTGAVLADEVEVELSGMATSAEQMDGLLTDAAGRKVDGVVLMSLGYTASLAVSAPLLATPLPLLFFNTQEADRVTDAFSYDELLGNHGMQGVQDLAAVMVRGGKQFSVVTGLLSQTDTRAELLRQLQVWRAASEISGSRLGSFGPSMPGMGDAQVEPDMLAKHFGIELLELSFRELGQAASAAGEAEIEAGLAFDRAHFEIAEDLTDLDHVRSLRLELGLGRLLEERSLAGVQLSFEQAAASPHLETIPFYGLSKLMGRGLAYAGEGDLLATVGSLIAQRLCGPATFTEMYTMDFSDNSVLHTHMAECNWRMARRDRKPRLLRREFTLAECRPFAAFAFGLEPGAVTLFDLALTAERRFRFILMEAEIMDFPPLPGIDAPNFKVRFQEDLRPVLSRYSQLGGTHHLALVYGRRACEFQLLAGHWNLECELLHPARPPERTGRCL